MDTSSEHKGTDSNENEMKYGMSDDDFLKRDVPLQFKRAGASNSFLDTEIELKRRNSEKIRRLFLRVRLQARKAGSLRRYYLRFKIKTLNCFRFLKMKMFKLRLGSINFLTSRHHRKQQLKKNRADVFESNE